MFPYYRTILITTVKILDGKLYPAPTIEEYSTQNIFNESQYKVGNLISLLQCYKGLHIEGDLVWP